MDTHHTIPPHSRPRSRFSRLLGASLAGAFLLGVTQPASAALRDGLVAYWPLDEVSGIKTPDLVNGYDMELENLTAADLVEGKRGKAFRFENARKTILKRIDAPGEQLPINQHPAFTVSFWCNVKGTGNNDLRLFSEASTTDNNPLFNIGMTSTGVSDQLDFLLRQTPWPTVDHIRTEAEPLDGTWHHITFVQQTDGSRAVFIDGVKDSLEIAAKPAGAWRLNTTTIGGILRATQSFWLTGAMDDVALWSRALSDAEITTVVKDGLVSVFPPIAKGMVAYWPLDEVVGIKTPDLVSGYDMELENLTAADLVPGKHGKAFKFENARKTILKRIDAPGEQLPINQHPAFTISFWSNVKGTGNNDLRLFSEASTTDNNPLFNIGMTSTGVSDQLDLLLRQTPWPTVDHIRTEGLPLDGTWHHITFIQQVDGSRAIYIDGVRDPLEIAAKPEGAWRVNTTTIGGILRAAQSFWLTGLMDDVALWSRALSDAEITSVVKDGTPVPFSKPVPLAIRSFVADYPAVAAGESVILRWDGTKNVQVEIDQGVGDVTAKTTSGLGSTSVALTQSRKFTLTLKRGTESVSKSVEVAAIAGVASGWLLVDNFDRYPAGLLSGNGGWFDLTANGISIVDLKGNRMVAPNAAGTAGILPLKSLTVPEGQDRTLFFRAYVTGDPGELVRGAVGLTDRNMRFGTDISDGNGNFGPSVVISDEQDIGEQFGAMNGFNAGVPDLAPEPIMDPDTIYNVWLDFKNGVFPADNSSTGDTFDIYVQKNGATQRVKVITDYVSNRDPVGDSALGLTSKVLDKLALGGRASHSSVTNLFFDDIYLSKSGFNSSVPRAAGFTTPVPSEAPKVAIRVAAGAVEITWNTGTLQSAASVNGPWTAVAGATAPSFKPTTTGQAAQFYRVSQ